MDTPTKPERNRIGDDLDTWKKLEQHFAKRYGADVWDDRESQKVKAGIFRHIIKKYAGKPKNAMERAEHKMLRAHHRAMIKKLYPNPWVRLARNAALLVLNVATTAAKLLVKLLKFMVNPTIGANKQTTTPAQTNPGQQQGATTQQQSTAQQQSKSTGMKNGQQQRGSQSKATGQKQGAGQQQGAKQQAGKQQTGKPQQPAQKQTMKPQGPTAKVRNLNPRQMVPSGTSKGMRRG